MTTKNRLSLSAVMITGSSIVVGCGGSSSGSCAYYGSSGSCAPANADPAGVFEGTLTDNTTQQEIPIVAIIDENGYGRMSGQDGTYYRINVGTAGNSVSGSYAGTSNSASFPDGGQTTTGSATGFVTQPGLSLTLTDQKNNAETLLLNIDSVYYLQSSLPTLAGTWNYSTNGFALTLTIQPSGGLSGTDSNNCTYSGAFGLIDTNFNAYSENYTRTCGSVADTFSGLTAYFPASGSGTNAIPAQIKLFADDNNSEFLSADLE